VSKDKLRIGVIGAGGRGTLAGHWAKSDRAALVAAVDRRPEGFADLAKAAGRDDFDRLDDYRRLLDRQDLDAVAVCSPDWFHEEHAIAALAAGKHVFCEKPLAITVKGCDRILAAARRARRRLYVGHNMRHMNFTRVMKEIVDSGAIGELKTAWVRHFVSYGGRYYFHDWHAESKKSTSLLLQKGAHDIDIVHWIAGSFSKRVTGLGALSHFGGTKPDKLTCDRCPERGVCPDDNSALEWDRPDRQLCCFRKSVDVLDNQMILMQLESGVQACYLQNHFAPEAWRNYTFIGTEGRIENVQTDGDRSGERTIVLRTRKSNSWREYADRVYDVKPAGSDGHGGADARITRDFVEFVLDGKEPVGSAAAARYSVAVGCLGAESIAEGGVPKAVPKLARGLAGM
jgi:predicted dehydrogenase